MSASASTPPAIVDDARIRFAYAFDHHFAVATFMACSLPALSSRHQAPYVMMHADDPDS